MKRELDDLEGNKMLLTGKGGANRTDSKEKTVPHSRNNGRSATEPNTNDHSMAGDEDELGNGTGDQ